MLTQDMLFYIICLLTALVCLMIIVLVILYNTARADRHYNTLLHGTLIDLCTMLGEWWSWEERVNDTLDNFQDERSDPTEH
jgi:hypothetical protein